MPTFCRHNRLEANCPICSRKPSSPRSPSALPTRRPASGRAGVASPTRRRGRGAGEVRVRRMARAVDDGYEHELVPGLRATVEAMRLADELAFSAARLEQLAAAPPGLYAEVARLDDVEEAVWLAFQIAYISPLEGDSPFAAIDSVRTAWATGELPALESTELGPRTAHDPGRGVATLAAYRTWVQRTGSQAAGLAGEAALTPQRRFERAFERLALPGFGRGPRYELLVLLGHLGIFDMHPWSLHPVDSLDPTTIAAKRMFGIGDAVNLQRRAAELATAAGVPIEALDLALVNWSLADDERITAGAGDVADEPHRRKLRALLRAEPGMSAGSLEPDGPEEPAEPDEPAAG